MLKKFLLIAVFVFGSMACGAGGGANSTKPAEEKPMPVGALMSEYEKSKEATKAKYTGKTLTVVGYAGAPPIMPTGADDIGVLSIMEKGGDLMKMLGCQFKATDKAEFSRVTGSQTVVIRGVFDDDTSTTLKSCKLVSVE